MHIEIIQLSIAYTLAIVFIFTAIVTGLSLIGIVKFTYASQQRVLFRVLIVELVIVSLGFFSGILKFDARQVQNQVVAKELNARKQSFEARLAAARKMLDAGDLSGAYGQVNSLFRSEELGEYLPIRDLFILNGDISTRREFWLEAVESYGPALKLDPNNVRVMVDAGFAQRKLENYEEAESLYERALATQGQDWEVLSGYYNCLRRYAAFLADDYPKISREKFQKAVVIVQQMTSVATTDKQRRISDIAKAALYWEWKQYDIAASTYRQLVQKYPGDTRFKEDLAAVLMEMSAFDEAKRIFADLYEAERKKGSATWFVGSGYAEAASKTSSTPDELDRALEAGLAAVTAKPDEPFSYYAVALVYKKKGNDGQARKYIGEAEALEARRDTNIHTYDRDRHKIYSELRQAWS